MTLVKICGITNLKDAVAAQKLGADMLGFNFWPGSKRFRSPLQVKSWIGKLPPTILKVGVFVDSPLKEILLAERSCNLGGIQLHGNESAEFIAELRKHSGANIIKAVRISSEADIENLSQFGADAILLDAFSETDHGGTGRTFDWGIAAAVKTIENIYLAGGLNSGNVTEAISQVRPQAVDAASGVEISPGVKDHFKMAAFIKNAKNAL